MKKRVTIYIDEADWMEVRLLTVEKKISMGDYFMSLHRKKIPKPVIRISDDICKPEVYGSTSESQSNIGDPRFAEEVKEERKKPKYTEKYKSQNPSERCDICGKTLSFCGC